MPIVLNLIVLISRITAADKFLMVLRVREAREYQEGCAKYQLARHVKARSFDAESFDLLLHINPFLVFDYSKI